MMPPGFLWGAATASYQIEGAVGEDGRGESIWDRFCATPGKVKNGDTGAVACDHYHRYRDDVALMKRLGLQAYRFSVAWPRILPEGVGPPNQAGLDFYRRLVDELLTAGIRPFATLYHWDLPQVLQDRHGGWLGRDTAEAFAAYAEVVSRALGDRVKDWITLNEPLCSSWLGHGIGIHAPGFRDPALATRATHNLLLGHGYAVPVIRDHCQGARVGISLNLNPAHPASESAADQAAARQADLVTNRLFLDPLYRGAYPSELLEQCGERAFGLKPGDMRVVSAPLDFLGVNYYTRSLRRADPAGLDPTGTEVRIDGVEHTAMDWEVYPDGLYEMLSRVHREYHPSAIYVTESGAAFPDVLTADGAVHDDRRRAYLESHFARARQLAAEGVSLRGYFVWSLLDNFEWAEGYGKRFGLVHVDYATQRRVVKDSGHWYAEFIGAS